MPTDERELRSRLAETAALAGPPRFTTEDLATRVRRSRRKRRYRTGIIAAVAVAAVASAVAIPLTRGGTGQPAISQPASSGPRPSYTVTVNGETRVIPATGRGQPLFTIAPGERLTMTVEVTVPAPQPMTGLWLGITNGILSPRADGPANMTILAASTHAPLRPGTHRFVLHWTVPAGFRPGTTRQLSAEWVWSGTEPGGAEGIVAELAVPLPSGASSPAAVARRLRAIALHSVTICDGGRPARISAVRTTFGKAMAAVGGGGDGITDNAGQAVYLVLMKGYFNLYSGGPALACVKQVAGHYFSAVVDAATFVTLEAGLGNRPPAVPLRTLGPVLNLG